MTGIYIKYIFYKECEHCGSPIYVIDRDHSNIPPTATIVQTVVKCCSCRSSMDIAPWKFIQRGNDYVRYE